VKDQLHHADSETWKAWKRFDGESAAQLANELADDNHSSNEEEDEGEGGAQTRDIKLDLSDLERRDKTTEAALSHRLSRFGPIKALSKPLDSVYLRRFQWTQRITRTRIGVMVVLAALIPFVTASIYATNSLLFSHSCVGCDFSTLQVRTWFVFLAVLCVWSMISL
jgi:hypothetical protein